jgi:xanthine/uracil permease
MLTIFITIIPLVNLIMYFVWAFGSDTHPSKKNWAKASLIWLAIAIVLYIIIFAIFGAAMMSSMNNNVGPDGF